MKHHHEVGPGLERLDITGLLVAAIALVLAVKNNAQPELARHLRSGVGGKIIDDNTLLNDAGRNFAKGLLQGPARIVGWHDDDDFWRWHLRPNHFQPVTN